MSIAKTSAPRRPLMLADVAGRLSPESLLASARGIEAQRATASDALLIDHHGLRVPGLWLTPYAWQAGVLARERGVVAFDRQERDLLDVPAAWVHPEIGTTYYQVKRAPERVVAPSLWPFMQDAPVADFDTRGAHAWWSHGLVHTLVGFGWWPSLSEWELMAMARLSEALAAVHWYNFAQLGRLTMGDLPMNLADLKGDEAERYLRLERIISDADERVRRLDDGASERIAENAIDTLRYEVYAYRSAIWDGDLVEPDDPMYLGLGESGEYAKVHHPRLMSDAHARWREHCLVADRDYATSPEAFESRVAAVLDRLVTPLPPSPADAPEPARLRARRVLQDVGWRICQHAANDASHDTSSAAALVSIADAIRQLDGDVVGDSVVASALEAVREAIGSGARRVLALGYRPTLDAAAEPSGVIAIRAQAITDRCWRMHAVVGAAMDSLAPIARRVVSGPRSPPLVDELTSVGEVAARAEEVPWEGYGYIGWMQVAYAAWFDGPGGEALRWHYRAARRFMPEDPATWDRFTVVWNPYAKRTPSPWDARWNDDLRRAKPLELGAPTKKFKPRPATAAYYVLMGPGRDGPIYLPLTPHLAALISLLKKPRRLTELNASRDFGPDYMRKAIADEAVLVFHAPLVDRPERAIDIYEIAMSHAAAIDQRVEPPGPWNEPDQAAAYAEFCKRSTLYRDSSAALCDAADIAPDARVGELGCGTGETSVVILERLGPNGQLVGADPAALMLEHVMGRVGGTGESRATFVAGAARALGFFAAGQGAFDRVLANSSLPLTDNITAELAIVNGALKPGGKVAFSLPAELLGQTDHIVTPEAVQVFAAIDTARGELGISPRDPDRVLDGALGSQDNMMRALTDAGFTDVTFSTYHRPWSAGEYMDWLSMPVLRRGLCKPGGEDKSEALIARLRELVDAELALESVWVLVVGTKPEVVEDGQ